MIHLKHLLEELYVPGFVSCEETKPFRVPENFDIHEQGYGWSVYKGANDWETGHTAACAYIGPEGYQREQARIWFEIKYPTELESVVGESLSSHNPLYQKIKEWGEQAIRKWIREVRNIHRKSNPIKRIKDVNHPNWKRKTWKECFLEALTSDTMKPYIKTWGVDHSNWRGMKQTSELNETFKQGKGWFVHEGSQSISVIFESGQQLSFELTFKNKTGEDKNKWRHQAASNWASLAGKLYNNPELNEIGNPIQKSWEECFMEALSDTSMKPFIKHMEPVFDPVNFTPRI
jgi:hypothetical protein